MLVKFFNKIKKGMLESTLLPYFNMTEYTPSYPIKNKSALCENLISANMPRAIKEVFLFLSYCKYSVFR